MRGRVARVGGELARTNKNEQGLRMGQKSAILSRSSMRMAS